MSFKSLNLIALAAPYIKLFPSSKSLVACNTNFIRLVQAATFLNFQMKISGFKNETDQFMIAVFECRRVLLSLHNVSQDTDRIRSHRLLSCLCPFEKLSDTRLLQKYKLLNPTHAHILRLEIHDTNASKNHIISRPPTSL